MSELSDLSDLSDQSVSGGRCLQRMRNAAAVQNVCHAGQQVRRKAIPATNMVIFAKELLIH